MISLTTTRLRIEPWRPEHAQAFFELTQDEGFNAHPITIYRQADLASAQKWIHSNTSKLAIFEKNGGALIGMGGLTPWILEDEELVDLTYRG
jgi:hypothetical protein